jgi:hypothetical protein
MSTIIAGHFELQEEVELARRALVDAGFSSERISGFYLSQPGQHDMTPIGGDNQHSPGAKETPEGVVQGATAGAAVGAVLRRRHRAADRADRRRGRRPGRRPRRLAVQL